MDTAEALKHIHTLIEQAQRDGRLPATLKVSISIRKVPSAVELSVSVHEPTLEQDYDLLAVLLRHEAAAEKTGDETVNQSDSTEQCQGGLSKSEPCQNLIPVGLKYKLCPKCMAFATLLAGALRAPSFP